MGAASGYQGGGSVASGGRPNYPPYPVPPPEYQSGGGYDGYQGRQGYVPGAPSGYQGGVAASGPGAQGAAAGGGDNYRSIQSFVPPPTPPPYNNRGNYSGGAAAGANVPSGPYPPSFQASNSGGIGGDNASVTSGSGALSSILQAPYNPQQAARQGKYPPILGGTPDPSPGAVGLVGNGPSRLLGGGVPVSGGVGSMAAGAIGGVGGVGTVSGVARAGGMTGGDSKPNLTAGLNLEGSKRSSNSLRDISPTPANISSGATTAATTQVTGINSTISGPGMVTPSPGGVLPTSASASTLPAPGPGDSNDAPILPKRIIPDPTKDYDGDTRTHTSGNLRSSSYNGIPIPSAHDSQAKKRDWLLNMNATLENTPVGQLDPNALPLSTIMNGWAKQKSSEGARMVEMWLDRVHSEYNGENPSVHPTARMYTMAVDAWAKSNGGAPAARRAEALLERMDRLYREGGGRHEALKPTTGIFNAVINVSEVSFCCWFALILNLSLNSSSSMVVMGNLFHLIYYFQLTSFTLLNGRHGPAPARRLPLHVPSRFSPGWKNSATRAARTSTSALTSTPSTRSSMLTQRVVRRKVQRRHIASLTI